MLFSIKVVAFQLHMFMDSKKKLGYPTILEFKSFNRLEDVKTEDIMVYDSSLSASFPLVTFNCLSIVSVYSICIEGSLNSYLFM